jgi:hypothetical protein
MLSTALTARRWHPLLQVPLLLAGLTLQHGQQAMWFQLLLMVLQPRGFAALGQFSGAGCQGGRAWRCRGGPVQQERQAAADCGQGEEAEAQDLSGALTPFVLSRAWLETWAMLGSRPGPVLASAA